MNTHFKSKKANWFILAIVTLGLLARIARCISEHDIRQDAVLYMNMAELWSEKGIDAAYSFMSWIPPLWPWVLSVGCSWGIEQETTAQTIGVILGASVSYSVFIACKSIFKNESYALVGALLVAVHPYLIRISTEMLRDSIYIPLVAIAVAIAMRSAESSRWWKWLLYGVISGLAVITRREGGELLIFLALWSILELIRNRSDFKITVKRLIIINMCAFAGATAIVLPVQCAINNTACTWTIIPDNLMDNVNGLLSGNEENLFKTLHGEP